MAVNLKVAGLIALHGMPLSGLFVLFCLVFDVAWESICLLLLIVTHIIGLTCNLGVTQPTVVTLC